MKDAKAALYTMPGKQHCSEWVSVLNLLFCLVLELPTEAQLIICSIYIYIWLFLKCAVLDSIVSEPLN